MASLANRYCKALFEVAQAEGSTAAVDADLAMIGLALEDRGVRHLLENPSVSKDSKAKMLERAMSFGDREPHARTRRFIEVLLDKGRQGLLPMIVRVYHDRALESRGEAEGSIESAASLEPADLETIQAAVGKRIGRRVTLVSKVDPDLLGGFRVHIGDRMFDATLKGQLESLGSKLRGLPVSVFVGDTAKE